MQGRQTQQEDGFVLFIFVAFFMMFLIIATMQIEENLLCVHKLHLSYVNLCPTITKPPIYSFSVGEPLVCSPTEKLLPCSPTEKLLPCSPTEKHYGTSTILPWVWRCSRARYASCTSARG
jgi:hypothetical protein